MNTKFILQEQQVIWKISINIVANYAADCFESADGIFFKELYNIYKEEYTMLDKRMYAMVILNTVKLYEKQGFIEPVRTSAALEVLLKSIDL